MARLSDAGPPDDPEALVAALRDLAATELAWVAQAVGERWRKIDDGVQVRGRAGRLDLRLAKAHGHRRWVGFDVVPLEPQRDAGMLHVSDLGELLRGGDPAVAAVTDWTDFWANTPDELAAAVAHLDGLLRGPLRGAIPPAPSLWEAARARERARRQERSDEEDVRLGVAAFDARDYEEAIRRLAGVEGALTASQAKRLEIARRHVRGG